MSTATYSGDTTVALEDSLSFRVQIATDIGTAVAADSAPAFRVYGQDPTGPLPNVAGRMSATGTTGLYSATIPAKSANGFAAHERFSIRLTYSVSSASRAYLFPISVT